MSLQFIRYSAYRLALRNRAQSVPYTISLKKKTPTLNGILPVFSIAGADIRNLTGYSTQLDHQAFPAYNHSFFFPSRHRNSTSSPHLLRPLILCWHSSVGVQQSWGKERSLRVGSVRESKGARLIHSNEQKLSDAHFGESLPYIFSVINRKHLFIVFSLL